MSGPRLNIGLTARLTRISTLRPVLCLFHCDLIDV